MLEEFGLPDAQSLDKLQTLISFARKYGLMHIVYSAAKIVSSRYKPMPQAITNLKDVYELLNAPDKLIFRGGSWRLPPTVAQKYIIEPFIKICDSYGMKTYFCKQNLLLTP
ncbi:MAG: hypothetical protein PHF37_08220 [Phycisphaerae bacterium]|nr:hypothetical protein [Phycisphaerae bacterium]